MMQANMFNFKKGIATVVCCWSVGLAGIASANTIFTGSNSSGLAAAADFSLSGQDLSVTLTNTSTADVLVPTDVLTAVFFDTSHPLVPVSASLNGSNVYYGSFQINVGEGWQLWQDGNIAHGLNSGIGAVGLGLFGPKGDFFLLGVTVDGLDYGILSAGDNSNTGNSGVTDHGPLIKNSVKFTLTVPAGFSLSELGNTVVFQYGTALDETSIPGSPVSSPGSLPEPTSLTLLVSALLGLGLVYLRRRGAKT